MSDMGIFQQLRSGELLPQSQRKDPQEANPVRYNRQSDTRPTASEPDKYCSRCIHTEQAEDCNTEVQNYATKHNGPRCEGKQTKRE
jgi:hypothetical protein